MGVEVLCFYCICWLWYKSFFFSFCFYSHVNFTFLIWDNCAHFSRYSTHFFLHKDCYPSYSQPPHYCCTITCLVHTYTASIIIFFNTSLACNPSKQDITEWKTFLNHLYPVNATVKSKLFWVPHYIDLLYKIFSIPILFFSILWSEYQVLETETLWIISLLFVKANLYFVLLSVDFVQTCHIIWRVINCTSVHLFPWIILVLILLTIHFHLTCNRMKPSWGNILGTIFPGSSVFLLPLSVM